MTVNINRHTCHCSSPPAPKRSASYISDVIFNHLFRERLIVEFYLRIMRGLGGLDLERWNANEEAPSGKRGILKRGQSLGNSAFGRKANEKKHRLTLIVVSWHPGWEEVERERKWDGNFH